MNDEETLLWIAVYTAALLSPAPWIRDDPKLTADRAVEHFRASCEEWD